MGIHPKRDPQLERLRHKVPIWYVPLHLGVSLGFLGGLSVALLFLLPSDPLPLGAWVAALFTLLLADFIEYALHRWPMHRRRHITKAFFKTHTIAHHRYFTANSMGITAPYETVFVVPSIPVVLTSLTLLVVVTVGWALILGTASGLFVGAFLGLFGTLKQILHLSFHFPDSWMRFPVLRSSLFQAMKKHHTIHHDPRLMTKWNFNIGIPLYDAVFRTLTWDSAPSSKS